MIVVGYYGITLAVHVSVCPLPVCRMSVHPPVFLFLDNNLSKCQWIFTNLGVCIDTVEIWFGIVNGQILSIFDNTSDFISR